MSRYIIKVRGNEVETAVNGALRGNQWAPMETFQLDTSLNPYWETLFQWHTKDNGVWVDLRKAASKHDERIRTPRDEDRMKFDIGDYQLTLQARGYGESVSPGEGWEGQRVDRVYDMVRPVLPRPTVYKAVSVGRWSKVKR
ncbi:MAG: hypothetical protein ISS48_03125 [Candidatus Aenigmarchaeota archaeon]|nr:hypothetical protein [Candidatus Aenigmarchaeota archaeon]